MFTATVSLATTLVRLARLAASIGELEGEANLTLRDLRRGEAVREEKGIVRAFQSAEGSSECFHSAVPARFKLPDGTCNNISCFWYLRCQMPHESHTRSLFQTRVFGEESTDTARSLRRLLVDQASRLGLGEEIAEQNNIDAVRYLQTSEGYTPCFGNRSPIVPSRADNQRCAEFECLWREQCDRIRSLWAKPVVIATVDSRTVSDGTASVAEPLHANYASVMREFYDHVRGIEDDEQLALLYFDFIRARSEGLGAIQSQTDRDCATISVATDDHSFHFMSRRLPLIAESGILTHETGRPLEFHGDDDIPKEVDRYSYHVRRYVDCPDLLRVGSWLRECRPLASAGSLFYLPKIWEERFYADSSCVTVSRAKTAPIVDALIKNRRIAQLTPKTLLTGTMLRPIVSIDLPTIEQTSLADFSQFTADEPEHFEAFRAFLREKFLDLAANETRESYETGILRIRTDIEKNIRSIATGFRALSRRRTFQVVGGAIGTTTATLLAIYGNVSAIVPSLLGGGGGLYFILKAVEDAVIGKLKLSENPCYYLWLLQQKKK